MGCSRANELVFLAVGISFEHLIRRGAFVGLLHRVMEDDVYNGMRIPKGTLVSPSAYGI